ncbi:hypothetical protein BGZ54_003769, partial [Gamsiella multidivaricata]
ALKWITIILQAGSSNNYGKELLRLHCKLRYAWSSQKKEEIMSSWLINTRGEKNHFLPADLFQEHCNLLIKTVYATKGSNATWDLLAEWISTNINTFATMSRQLEEQYDDVFCQGIEKLNKTVVNQFIASTSRQYGPDAVGGDIGGDTDGDMEVDGHDSSNETDYSDGTNMEYQMSEDDI